MRTSRVASFPVDIFMAGDINKARDLLRQYIWKNPNCVTLLPLDYIYFGGEEAGFKVGLINYPRFPKEPDTLIAEASLMANMLLEGLAQKSYSIQTPTETLYYERVEK